MAFIGILLICETFLIKSLSNQEKILNFFHTHIPPSKFYQCHNIFILSLSHPSYLLRLKLSHLKKTLLLQFMKRKGMNLLSYAKLTHSYQNLHAVCHSTTTMVISWRMKFTKMICIQFL